MRPVVAPVPGRVRHVAVRPSEAVARGQVLFELEVLGMAQRVTAPVEGSIRLLLVQGGEVVHQGALLAEIDV